MISNLGFLACSILSSVTCGSSRMGPSEWLGGRQARCFRLLGTLVSLVRSRWITYPAALVHIASRVFSFDDMLSSSLHIVRPQQRFWLAMSTHSHQSLHQATRYTRSDHNPHILTRSYVRPAIPASPAQPLRGESRQPYII